MILTIVFPFGFVEEFVAAVGNARFVPAVAGRTAFLSKLCVACNFSMVSGLARHQPSLQKRLVKSFLTYLLTEGASPAGL